MKRAAGYFVSVGLTVILALFVAVLDPPPLPRLRELVFDTYQRLQPRQYDPDIPVRIVAIDEKSLRELGQMPWPRNLMGTLTSNLAAAGASAVAFDISFDQPDRSSPKDAPAAHDEAFAQALASAPAVLGILGTGEAGPSVAAKAGFVVAGDDISDFAPRFGSAIGPIPSLLNAASGLGSLNWLPDGDRVIRKVPTVITAAGALAPSLSLEALRIAQGTDTIIVKGSNAGGETAFGQSVGVNTVKAGAFEIPTDPSGEMRLYARSSVPKAWISASDVVKGTFDPDDVNGRIVFIGITVIGADPITTPVEASLPGVEAHAQATEQILAGLHLVRPDWIRGFEIVLIGALGLILAGVLRALRARSVLATFLGLAFPIGIVIGSWFLFSHQRLLMDPVMPAASSLALVLVATAWHLRESEQRREQIRGIFGRFVNPEVVQQLVANPDRIVLGGEIRPLTLLFSDVRNFTSLAENLSPSDVVSLVRRIHTPTTQAVLRHGGTIDKYIGDGMMAFWNAPLDDPDHAAHACLAALEIVAVTQSFKDPPIAMGVGIHTGDACVGNIGSEQRLEYSALGDNVNLASRVEQLTKTFKVQILVTEATRAAAPHFAFLEIEKVRVKGRQGATTLYALHHPQIDDAFLELKHRHAEMLEAYRRQDAAAMRGALERSAALYKPAYEGLFDYYLAQSEWLRGRTGPWDGVLSLDQK